MNPRVKSVDPLPGFKLSLTFTNEEHRVFDVKPYLSKGIFSSLSDADTFKQVRLFNGSILWPGDLDLCPDTLYEGSVKTG
ncbi:MAG: DUF2442 domain-containing protein [Chitinophagales bacterium]